MGTSEAFVERVLAVAIAGTLIAVASSAAAEIIFRNIPPPVEARDLGANALRLLVRESRF